MNDRCYDLCSNIHSKLVSTGWKQVTNGIDGYRYYVQTVTVNYDYDIRLVVQNTYDGICDGGDIGIAWLEIRDNNIYLQDGYLSPCDFGFMNGALAVVEQNLLRLNIPFSRNYGFKSDLLKEINLKLRDDLHIDEIVDEFYKEEKDHE